MPRPKRQPEPFDVVDFLRESDNDLKSALNSLLRSPAIEPEPAPPVNPTAGPKLVPPPELTSQAANVAPGPSLDPGLKLNEPVNTTSGPELRPGPDLRPGVELRPGIELGPGLDLRPGPELTTPAPAAPKRRQFPIREMKLAQDAHSRSEQQVYECLWQVAKPLDDVSRTITIGFGAMARLVRLSESNARINLRNLVAKLAIEEYDRYDCERSVGKTYRIFNYPEILRRRREVGLTWYMRRTLAVIFVDPSTGQPVNLSSIPGPNLIPGAGPNLRPPPGPNLGGEPGVNLGPPYRESLREQNFRKQSSSSSSHARVLEALSQYGTADDDVLARLRELTRELCADFTDDELIHFIHAKGQLIRRKEVSSPIGFLLASVPKCFAGEAFQLFRSAQKGAEEKRMAEQGMRDAELENFRREQHAVLEDPNAPEADKEWARQFLYPDAGS